MLREVAGPVDGAEAVRAERRRIVSTLLEHLDALVQAAVEAIRTEIPAYAAQEEHFFVDVRDQVRKHFRVKLGLLLEEREVALEDIAFARGGAMRRARAGFALEDYLNAFRVGQQVFWERVLACAGETPLGHEAALTLTRPLLRYCDFVSTHAGHAYVESQQYVVADADRERRDLLEHLLAGRMPTSGPLLAAARAYGLGAETPMMVALAVPVGPQADADAPHAASAMLTRVVPQQAKILVVVRQAEIVAVPALCHGIDPAELCDHLEAAHDRLRKEGTPLAMGISTVATGVAELPRACLEARTALESVAGGGGVVALPRLSPFDYLALRADDTARWLVDARLRAFLDDDRARGGVLTATVRAFADADLNLRLAAGRLQVHPNTAQYRLRRIEERTGRNPRRIADLLDLLVAIELDDGENGKAGGG
ncbi:MAG TPA: helix-turn-helix domain-containing protein [Actinomycetota bacterium]|nr:helix-turn-helix domain-containing protein [Actinomycetota bacterium]